MTDYTGKQLDNYSLQRLLGRGAFGEVYLAEHTHTHRVVAVKMLTTQLSGGVPPGFLHEARTLFLLKHPHIVPLLDFGVENSIPFLVMEYAPNGTLRQQHQSGACLPLTRVNVYVQQIASAIHYAHEQRLIHRDIKPQNMLVGQEGQVLLSDFGVAANAHSEQSLKTQEMTGTVSYMAPEQIHGKARPASDQYALGICVYEWLCGVRPFVGSTWEVVTQHLSADPAGLRSHVPYLPPAVEQVVLQALAKDPQQRFASVAAFAAALHEASHFPPVGVQQSVALPAQEEVSQLAPLPVMSPLINQATTFPTSASPVSGTGGTLAESLYESPTLPNQPGSSHSAGPVLRHPSSEHPEAFSPPFTTRAEQTSITLPAGSAADLPLVALAPRRVWPRARWLLLIFCILILLLGGILVPLRANGTQGNASPAATALTRASVAATATSQAGAAAAVYTHWVRTSGIMSGFDAARTHWNRLEQIISPANVASLRPLSFSATGGSIVSSPVVADGIVYVGSLDGRFYAFDATCQGDCLPLWSYPTGARIFSSPAIANGMVYVGSENHIFYAFDAACRSLCQPLWSYRVGDSIDSSPVVAGGLVSISGSGPGDRHLYAFDATCRRKCQPLWSYTTGIHIFTELAVANGLLYVGSYDHKLYAFRATCRSDCQPLWSYTTGGIVSSSPAVADGVVYVSSGDGQLYAFGATCQQSTCPPLWSFALPGNDGESAPAVANGLVYIGSLDGTFYAFDAVCRSACRPLWSYMTGSRINSAAMVANGVVYIGSGDHNLYAFDAACRSACQPLWSFATGGEISSSPTIANGRVYVGSWDEKLYAFGFSGKPS